MAIKNYTSDKPIEKIFAELQHTLGTHGAKHISFEYGDDGKVQGVVEGHCHDATAMNGQ
jgi:hypothetical protein